MKSKQEMEIKSQTRPSLASLMASEFKWFSVAVNPIHGAAALCQVLVQTFNQHNHCVITHKSEGELVLLLQSCINWI